MQQTAPPLTPRRGQCGQGVWVNMPPFTMPVMLLAEPEQVLGEIIWQGIPWHLHAQWKMAGNGPVFIQADDGNLRGNAALRDGLDDRHGRRVGQGTVHQQRMGKVLIHGMQQGTWGGKCLSGQPHLGELFVQTGAQQ